MDIACVCVQFVTMDDGAFAIEVQAIGRQGQQTYGPLSARVPWTWPATRQAGAQLAAAAQSQIRQAFSDAYGLSPITSGRFVVIELLG